MTLTTGLVPVATTTDAAEALRDVLLPARTTQRPLWLLAVALDVVAAAISVVVVAGLTPDVGLPPAFAVLLAAWPVLVAVSGGYARMVEDPYSIRVRPLLAAGLGLAAAAWVAVAAAPASTGDLSARAMAATTLLFAGSVSLSSLGARGLVPLVIPRRPLTAVLVGAEPEVRALLREADRPGCRREFAPVAVCLPEASDDPSTEPWHLPVRHGVDDNLLDVVRSHGAEAVVVVPGAGIGSRELRRWAAWLQDRDVQLLVSSGLHDVATARIGTATLGCARLVRVRPARLRGAGALLKGAADRLGALLLLVALAPLLALLTLLIRLDSPGPARFRQTRIGRNGRPFTVHKFRTMTVDADVVRDHLVEENESDREGVLFKIRQDPRVTRLGSVLRKYSLDELPQLVNVLRGEMSLVGPRPALPEEVQGYSPDLRRRLVVKPGMTGLWQVSGRSDLSWEETVRMDLLYVDNWSWTLDLNIAARTLGAVLGHKGAY
jgi:exopolysaccharide biosynthesis polyprenyl glycosylphosphotransferase